MHSYVNCFDTQKRTLPADSVRRTQPFCKHMTVHSAFLKLYNCMIIIIRSKEDLHSSKRAKANRATANQKYVQYSEFQMSCISLVLSEFTLQVMPLVSHHKEDCHVMGRIDYSKVSHLGIIECVIIPRCPAVVIQKTLTLHI